MFRGGANRCDSPIDKDYLRLTQKEDVFANISYLKVYYLEKRRLTLVTFEMSK